MSLSQLCFIQVPLEAAAPKLTHPPRKSCAAPSANRTEIKYGKLQKNFLSAPKPHQRPLHCPGGVSKIVKEYQKTSKIILTSHQLPTFTSFPTFTIFKSRISNRFRNKRTILYSLRIWELCLVHEPYKAARKHKNNEASGHLCHE